MMAHIKINLLGKHAHRRKQLSLHLRAACSLQRSHAETGDDEGVWLINYLIQICLLIKLTPREKQFVVIHGNKYKCVSLLSLLEPSFL